MADIKSRMATVRALYRENPSELRPEALRALARAEEYFGFGSPHAEERPAPRSFSKNSGTTTFLSWPALWRRSYLVSPGVADKQKTGPRGSCTIWDKCIFM